MNAVTACITVVYPAPQDVLLIIQTRRIRTSVMPKKAQSGSGARQDFATTANKQYVRILCERPVAQLLSQYRLQPTRLECLRVCVLEYPMQHCTMDFYASFYVVLPDQQM